MDHLKPSNALSTNELWDRFYMYEYLACDGDVRNDLREIYATLTNAVARLIAARMP